MKSYNDRFISDCRVWLVDAYLEELLCASDEYILAQVELNYIDGLKGFKEFYYEDK